MLFSYLECHLDINETDVELFVQMHLRHILDNVSDCVAEVRINSAVLIPGISASIGDVLLLDVIAECSSGQVELAWMVVAVGGEGHHSTNGLNIEGQRSHIQTKQVAHL